MRATKTFGIPTTNIQTAQLNRSYCPATTIDLPLSYTVTSSMRRHHRHPPPPPLRIWRSQYMKEKLITSECYEYYFTHTRTSHNTHMRDTQPSGGIWSNAMYHRPNRKFNFARLFSSAHGGAPNIYTQAQYSCPYKRALQCLRVDVVVVGAHIIIFVRSRFG